MVRAWRDGEFKHFADAWKQRWDASHDAAPARLYHYTSLDGLLGILGKRAIWATNAICLNDMSELSYINMVISDVATELSKQFKGRAATAFLEVIVGGLELTRDREVYVSCFCECGDQLSQWRGYSPARGGYAIGFQTGPMHTGTGYRLRRVEYDEHKQAASVRCVLEFIAAWLEGFGHDCSEGRLNYLVIGALLDAAYVLHEAAFCFKHPGFAEEKEWRLVHLVERREHLCNTPLLFRRDAHGVVPYVELQPNGQQPGTAVDSLLPIEELVVGPNPQPSLAQEVARCLLAGHGFPLEVIVRGSTIPLRV
jgi:hypothetical protein